MSDRAYLSASNADTIYPSFAQRKYNALEQLIATGRQLDAWALLDLR